MIFLKPAITEEEKVMFEYQRVAAEINLDNIEHNMREIRKRVDEKAKIMAIVKADAYGHGAVEVSKVALYSGADWLGVAICDEGVQLRENNIFEPILILGYTPETKIDAVILNGLTQTVFSYENAQKLSRAAVRLGKTAYIHIKIDTGMGRIGFKPCEESIKEIVKISCLPNIEITGVFTHFATADEKDKGFTYEQYNKFVYVTDELEKRGIKNIIRHAANSGAILDMPELRLDMVRAGIILYGLFPSDEVKHDIELLPCMSLKTHVSYIKKIDKGVSVGYGRSFFADKETSVATIPVGYADGYARTLSNKARVIVAGEYANVIGNVCMDQFMVDITGIKGVSADDEVILFGRQADKEITIDEIAGFEGTINYEIVCNIGKRVPRIYIRNSKVLKTVRYV